MNPSEYGKERMGGVNFSLLMGEGEGYPQDNTISLCHGIGDV